MSSPAKKGRKTTVKQALVEEARYSYKERSSRTESGFLVKIRLKVFIGE